MNWAWAASLDQLWRSPSLPMWATLVAGVFFGLVLLVTLFRAEKSMANGALAVITLLAIAVAVASGLRGFGDGNRAVAASSQSIQPLITLPALTCLDGLAGDSVEVACERALFASADSAAAAVSYTANQITRLTALGDTVAASKVMTPELSALRRVIERDRYGFAAQVLLTREKCSPTSCDMFRSLSDWRHVSANMAERTYEGLVSRHVANWAAQPSVASTPSTAPSTALAGVPAATPTGRPSTVEFPTAASIPPVNIMGTEPPVSSSAAPQAAAPVPRNPAPTAPPPAAQQSPAPRQAATTAPSSPVAAKKQSSPKQQRTTAPVQLAPPVEADDN